MSAEEMVDKWASGHFECPKCKCYLVSNILSYKQGATFANNEPQRCPNECGPMWRVTWKDYAMRMSDSQEKLLERMGAMQLELEQLRAAQNVHVHPSHLGPAIVPKEFILSRNDRFRILPRLLNLGRKFLRRIGLWTDPEQIRKEWNT